jgi:hypothetical protein
MKTNLKQEIEKDMDFIIDKFLSIPGLGWKREDCYYITRKMESGDIKLSIVFYPQILHYRENEENKSVVWIRCRVYSTNNSDFTIANQIKEDIKLTGLKPFYDEDAWKNIFTRPLTDTESTQFSFFMNPDYPNGYWENHTIDFCEK